ncbi:MAG: peptidoglycan bridge formation glycyltransferase FemA/FemB family protein [Anaerolineae bacterium]|nr:peptidoglycan bridge formation glycyltransferase FemA/FemB family protein [Anaerolineae bacterium]
MFTAKHIDNAGVWNSALLALPKAHVLQSWAWGRVKGQHSWRVERWLWGKPYHPLAAAQILIQQRSGARLGYVPKGPLLDWTNLDLVKATVEDLERLARRKRLLLLKIDPDVQNHTRAGRLIVQLLEQRGWRPSFEQIQYRNTMILDLRDDAGTILGNMKAKARYNVRLAERRGVEVREATPREFPLLYAMYVETAQRQNFIIREEAYYLETWQTLTDAGHASPLIAVVAGIPVAMLVLLHFGEYAWYMYGASRDIHRDTMPNHALQWEAILRAKKLGCKVYDLWGAPDTLDESDPMWGVYRFKESLGAAFESHIGAYDFAPFRLLYRAYAFLRPRMVERAQRRYWHLQP